MIRTTMENRTSLSTIPRLEPDLGQSGELEFPGIDPFRRAGFFFVMPKDKKNERGLAETIPPKPYRKSRRSFPIPTSIMRGTTCRFQKHPKVPKFYLMHIWVGMGTWPNQNLEWWTNSQICTLKSVLWWQKTFRQPKRRSCIFHPLSDPDLFGKDTYKMGGECIPISGFWKRFGDTVDYYRKRPSHNGKMLWKMESPRHSCFAKLYYENAFKYHSGIDRRFLLGRIANSVNSFFRASYAKPCDFVVKL